jgi:hypothetical protein
MKLMLSMSTDIFLLFCVSAIHIYDEGTPPEVWVGHRRHNIILFTHITVGHRPTFHAMLTDNDHILRYSMPSRRETALHSP